jgi:hypothetical protein
METGRMRIAPPKIQIGSRPRPLNPNSQLSEDQELFGQLLKWADLSQDPRWQAIAPEDRDKIVNAIKCE